MTKGKQTRSYRALLKTKTDKMADDSPQSSNVNPDDKQPQLEAKVEDAETRAVGEELRHSHISDGQANTTTTQPPVQDQDEEMRLRSGREYEYSPPPPKPKKKRPDLSPPEAFSAGEAGERKVSSPKKKRAHDEVEEHKQGEGRASNGADIDDWVLVEEADKAEKDAQAEPQKKRARDEKSPPADIHQTAAAVSSQTTAISMKA